MAVEELPPIDLKERMRQVLKARNGTKEEIKQIVDFDFDSINTLPEKKRSVTALAYALLAKGVLPESPKEDVMQTLNKVPGKKGGLAVSICLEACASSLLHPDKDILYPNIFTEVAGSLEEIGLDLEELAKKQVAIRDLLPKSEPRSTGRFYTAPADRPNRTYIGRVGGNVSLRIQPRRVIRFPTRRKS